jgi:hypothetical protein
MCRPSSGRSPTWLSRTATARQAGMTAPARQSPGAVAAPFSRTSGLSSAGVHCLRFYLRPALIYRQLSRARRSFRLVRGEVELAQNWLHGTVSRLPDAGVGVAVWLGSANDVVTHDWQAVLIHHPNDVLGQTLLGGTGGRRAYCGSAATAGGSGYSAGERHPYAVPVDQLGVSSSRAPEDAVAASLSASAANDSRCRRPATAARATRGSPVSGASHFARSGR